MTFDSGHQPVERAGGKSAGRGRFVRGVLTCMLVQAAATAIGGAIGLGAGLLALQLSEGDARGGEMLLVGFSSLGGCALGFVAGLVWAARYARRWGAPRGTP